MLTAQGLAFRVMGLVRGCKVQGLAYGKLLAA